MNPHIRGIAEEADNEINIGSERYLCDISPEYLQRFAELIIKECVSVAWFAEQYGINGDMAVSAQIQKHFGVKR